VTFSPATWKFPSLDDDPTDEEEGPSAMGKLRRLFKRGRISSHALVKPTIVEPEGAHDAAAESDEEGTSPVKVGRPMRFRG
jgi:hypothetical protein